MDRFQLVIVFDGRLLELDILLIYDVRMYCASAIGTCGRGHCHTLYRRYVRAQPVTLHNV